MITSKIKNIATKYPENIAYQVNEKNITYKDLWAKATYYGEILKSQGSDPVIIYGDKSLDVVIAILSCLIVSRTYIPIGTCTPKERLLKIIEQTNSSLILTDIDLDIKNIDICSLANLSNFKHSKTPFSISNDIAYIIFTSGSTGNPKGVPISYNNLNNFVSWISNLKPLKDYQNVKVLNQASFSFDLSVADFYYALCNGHTLIAYDTCKKDDFFKLYDIMKAINVAVMTPTLMKLCLLNKEFTTANYHNLKCIYFCGEPLEKELVQKIFQAFPNLNIINAYGPTEATSAISAINITSKMLETEDLLPVGVITNTATEVDIVSGEIVLKGSSVFSGYLGNITGGYYKENDVNCFKTGDLGYIKDNKLYCQGRVDRQVKYLGYRIELDDIERNILTLNGVTSCAVIAKRDTKNIVKSITAFVVGNNIEKETLKKELSLKIPGYMMPKTIKIIPQMPINQNGKIDRKELEKL